MDFLDSTLIPSPVLGILDTLGTNGYEGHIVGGCVRDLFLGREPKDWDITTDAEPEDVLRMFPDSFYENDFGTVGVKTEPFLPRGKAGREHDVVEVTTYRTESDYSDRRRPDRVTFVTSLTEDLSRRDFTMNAIALSVRKSEKEGRREVDIVDPFHGRDDIGRKTIRTVGNPDQRFGEDALRMMRAIRLFSELRKDGALPDGDWTIETTTLAAIGKHSALLSHVSMERIRDEFSRIILSDSPADGVELLRTTGLLRQFLPELEEGVGVAQNLHHRYEIYDHNIRSLRACRSDRLDVRLAALFHDIGKTRTKRGSGYRATFHGHEHVGARMTRKILERLRFPKDITDRTSLLVDQHMFYYNVDEVTESSVRRLIRRVGLENMRDLIELRIADRLGSGVPKAKPYKLRHLEYVIEKVSNDPVSVKMLAIGGNDLQHELGLAPGPKIGAILDVLLSETIEDPSLNTKETLLRRSKELDKEALDTLRERAKEIIEDRRQSDDRKIRGRHRVS
ncbi:MAG: HD domain-containing protein [Candidatus Moranbacteria bacterium]|nr:HD domain-containing protein [Candidatus Moranbacteria bacterium]NTW45939.1 HD domain-containing protein [Candidatus Moranbacteria bacterium]